MFYLTKMKKMRHSAFLALLLTLSFTACYNDVEVNEHSAKPDSELKGIALTVRNPTVRPVIHNGKMYVAAAGQAFAYTDETGKNVASGTYGGIEVIDLATYHSLGVIYRNHNISCLAIADNGQGYFVENISWGVSKLHSFDLTTFEVASQEITIPELTAQVINTKTFEYEDKVLPIQDLAFGPDQQLWLAAGISTAEGKVLIYDLAKKSVSKEISLPIMPIQLDFDRQNNFCAVTCSDYTNGRLAIIDSQTYEFNFYRSFKCAGDLSWLAYQNHLYRLEKFNCDSFTVVSQNSPTTVIGNYSTKDLIDEEDGLTSSNPQDLAFFDSHENIFAYLTRYESNKIWLINPLAWGHAQFKLNSIDLGEYQDQDGNAEFTKVIVYQDKAYICAQRLYRDGYTFKAVNTSFIVVLDTKNHQEIDTRD